MWKASSSPRSKSAPWSPPEAVTSAWTTEDGCAWKLNWTMTSATPLPAWAWTPSIFPEKPTACTPCSWRTRKPQKCSIQRHGNASRTVPRKSRSTSSRMFPPSSRPPCARIRWKGSISWLTLPRTGSAAFWRMTWAWVKRSSPSLTSSGCVKNSPAKTNPRKKSSSLRFLSFAPNPCWTSGREKRKNLRQACASSSSAARTRPIWKTSRRITTWSWSTTPSSASAGKP